MSMSRVLSGLSRLCFCSFPRAYSYTPTRFAVDHETVVHTSSGQFTHPVCHMGSTKKNTETPLSVSSSSLSPSSSTSASTSTSTPTLPTLNHFFLLMPQLSPSMKKGKISKWLIGQQQTHTDSETPEEIKSYQLLLEVQTNELTEDGSLYTLEIESHDEGLLEKLLVPEGMEVDVHTPIALLREEMDDNEQSQRQSQRPPCLWQGYVKTGYVLPSCGCSPTLPTTEK